MPPTLPTRCTSERLLLRRCRLADVPAYLRMLRENQAHLRQFLPSNLETAQDEDDIRVNKIAHFTHTILQGCVK